MTTYCDGRSGNVEVIRLHSKELAVDVSPAVGGRIVQIQNRETGHAFLWNNVNLKLVQLPPDSPYDPNFFGGIDELLPNDIPEMIDGVACPDHGELWTLGLDAQVEGGTLVVRGRLPGFGLRYERTMALRNDCPVIDLHYRITNDTADERHFMWKLHAAIAIAEGDVIECPARQAQVADLAYSRFQQLDPFRWPDIAGQKANVVPPKDGTVDFFYLCDLEEGRIAWTRPSDKLKFEYRFNTRVFPFAWLFASYGGFDGHYTAILEPCSSMPISVNEALAKGSCSRLAPGEVLETNVSIYAGPSD